MTLIRTASPLAPTDEACLLWLVLKDDGHPDMN